MGGFTSLVVSAFFADEEGISNPTFLWGFLFSRSIFIPFALIVESLWIAARGAGKLISSYLSGLFYPLASGSLISCLYFFNFLLLHHILRSVIGVSFQSVFWFNINNKPGLTAHIRLSPRGYRNFSLSDDSDVEDLLLTKFLTSRLLICVNCTLFLYIINFRDFISWDGSWPAKNGVYSIAMLYPTSYHYLLLLMGYLGQQNLIFMLSPKLSELPPILSEMPFYEKFLNSIFLP